MYSPCLHLSVEELESRLVPSGTPVPTSVFSLPAITGVLHISLQQDAVVISQDDGTIVANVAWPARGTVQLVGADGGDTFALNFAPVAAHYRALPMVQLVGGQGQNSIVVNGRSANDRAWLQDAGGAYRAGKFTLQMANIQNIQLIGAGPCDRVRFIDSSGDDVFTAAPSSGAQMLYGDGDSSSVQGFAVVTAISHNGGSDTAVMTTTAGIDRIHFTPKQSGLRAPRYRIRADEPRYLVKGFFHVEWIGNPAGGIHFLAASGSAAQDVLTVHDGQGTLSNPGQYELDFSGFQVMAFVMPHGANAQTAASLSTDAPGNDTFVANGEVGDFLQDRNDYQVQLTGFQQVQLNDTSGGTNLLSRTQVAYELSASGFTFDAAYHPFAGLPIRNEFAKIRALSLALDPALGQITDPLTLAIALRDFVNHRYWLGAGPINPWSGEDPYSRFLAALVYRTQPILCQGVQIVFADVLKAFHIPARYVSLYAPDGNNHATTEAWIGGHWIAMDATFDVSFVSLSGRYLSYAQLRTTRYIVEHNGTQSQPRIPFEFYTVPLSEFLTTITYPPMAS